MPTPPRGISPGRAPDASGLEIPFPAAGPFPLRYDPPRPIDERSSTRGTCGAESGRLSPAVTRRVIAFAITNDPDAAATEALDRLGAREREVLELLGRGRSNAEIAQALVVSAGTVKTHVANLFLKLGLRDRAQAVVFAYESGVIPAGDARR